MKFFQIVTFSILISHQHWCIYCSASNLLQKPRIWLVCILISPQTGMICGDDSTHAPHDHSNQ